jgi:hypothetical protein
MIDFGAGGGFFLAAAAAAAPTTWNPLDKATDIVLSNGNLTATGASVGGTIWVRSTNSVTTGRYYFECVVGSADGFCVGAATAALNLGLVGNINQYGWTYYSAGSKYHNAAFTAHGVALVSGDVVGACIDCSAGAIGFTINGAAQGGFDPATGANPAFSGLTGPLFALWGDASGSGAPSGVARFSSSAWGYTPPGGYQPLS